MQYIEAERFHLRLGSLFYLVLGLCSSGLRWRIFLQVFVGAPMTTATTAASTSQALSGSSLSSCCFSSFSFFLMFPSLEWPHQSQRLSAAAYQWSHGWPIAILSVCIWKSPKILARSFSTTLGGDAHFDLRICSSCSTQMFPYIAPATWLWCFMFSFPASILQPSPYILLRCLHFSRASLHILRLISWLEW